MVFVQWWHIELGHSDEVSLGLSKTEGTMDIASPHHPMFFFFSSPQGYYFQYSVLNTGLIIMIENSTGGDWPKVQR